MKENWKKIPGFPSSYEVSDQGNIRKEGFDNEYTLMKLSHSDGYVTVSIEGKQFRVHRLVALAFLPNPENKPYVKHLDDDRFNNKVSNLEWSTPSENMQHKVFSGLSNNKLIRCVETDEVFGCVTAVDFYTGIPREAIVNSIKTGDICFGLHFERINKDDVDYKKILYISGGDVVELSKKLKNTKELKEYCRSKYSK